MQPERSPQQADQAREHESKQGEDVKLGSGWKAQREDKERVEEQDKTAPATDQNKTVGQDWRVRDKQ